MIELKVNHKDIMLEALEELLYKYSLQLSTLKGGPMDKERKALTEKQEQIEALQHEISKQN